MENFNFNGYKKEDDGSLTLFFKTKNWERDCEFLCTKSDVPEISQCENYKFLSEDERKELIDFTEKFKTITFKD